MTLEEVKRYYRTWANFEKETGMSQKNLTNWNRYGHIPLLSQVRLEQLSKGVLRASLPRYGEDE